MTLDNVLLPSVFETKKIAETIRCGKINNSCKSYIFLNIFKRLVFFYIHIYLIDTNPLTLSPVNDLLLVFSHGI